MTESESQQFEAIRGWLNGKKNYQQGLLLLKAYHQDHAKVTSLEKYQNDYLLHNLMRELYDALKAKKQQATNNEPKVVQEIAKIAAPISEIPANPKSRDLKKLEDIKKARTQLYKERAKFHTEMCQLAYNESGTLKPILIKHEIERRHELAKLIIGHTEKIDSYWSIQDYYELNGIWPQEVQETLPEPIRLTNAEALRQLMNTRSTITKTEKKIADAKIMVAHQSGKQLDKTKENIAKWEGKLAILKAEKLELEKQVHEQKGN